MRKLWSSFTKSPCKIEFSLNPTTPKGTNPTITINDPNDHFTNGKPTTLMIFGKDDPISGKVIIKPEKQFDHQGIKIELIGEIGN